MKTTFTYYDLDILKDIDNLEAEPHCCSIQI